MHFKERVRSPTGVLLLALLALVAVAAGCGDLENNDQSSTTAPIAASGDPTGSLTWSNWPLYIDPGKDGTLANFEQDTGVKVDYVEDINDNQAFFAKLQPTLAEGDSEGRSLITVSDWLAAKMYDLGYLQRIDPSAVPNVEKNLIPALRHPSADPERDFTVPWQAGMTGIIVNKELAPDIDSISDLYDPKYKGHITMLTELRDTVPMTLKSMGIDPDTATPEQWMEAVDKIKAAADSGQIRKFTGNDYIRELASGDAWASLGWSGDAVQLQADNPNLEWRMPTEGCMLWSENMIIPVGAPNPTAAEAFMNYVYIPEVQANIAEYVNYVTPVEGVQEILKEREPELAENDLIFPSASFTKNCSPTPTLEGKEEQNVIRAFDEVLNG
jgi:spermidine/putrescine transport system substrate-binding protein